jgi:NAD(P)-dependent dehydrogenase (short-subunit alcohol dehydrogenase family)
MNDLFGKNAVITGGATGIGLAMAKSLVRAGCSVTI